MGKLSPKLFLCYQVVAPAWELMQAAFRGHSSSSSAHFLCVKQDLEVLSPSQQDGVSHLSIPQGVPLWRIVCGCGWRLAL